MSRHRPPRRYSAGDIAGMIAMVLVLLALLPVFGMQLAVTGVWP